VDFDPICPVTRKIDGNFGNFSVVVFFRINENGGKYAIKVLRHHGGLALQLSLSLRDK